MTTVWMFNAIDEIRKQSFKGSPFGVVSSRRHTHFHTGCDGKCRPQCRRLSISKHLPKTTNYACHFSVFAYQSDVILIMARLSKPASTGCQIKLIAVCYVLLANWLWSHYEGLTNWRHELNVSILSPLVIVNYFLCVCRKSMKCVWILGLNANANSIRYEHRQQCKHQPSIPRHLLW